MRLLVGIIEEGRVFLRPNSKDAETPTSHILFSRVGKYNVSLIGTSQEPSSVARTIKANCNIMIAMGLSDGDEIRSVARSLNLSAEQLSFYMKMPKGQAIVKYKNLEPFVIQIPLFPAIESFNISEAEIEKETSQFLKRITPEYLPEAGHIHTPDQKTDEVVLGAAADNASDFITEDHKTILKSLGKNPFINKSTLKSETGFAGAKLNREINNLELMGYILPHEINVKNPGRKSHFSELTEKAYERLKSLKLNFYKPRGKGSYQSKLSYHLIKSKLEKDGWDANIECLVPGSDNKLADVLAFRNDRGFEAYEYSLSKSNLWENCEKDLSGGINKVILVFETKSEASKAEADLKRMQPDFDKSKVGFAIISDFY